MIRQAGVFISTLFFLLFAIPCSSWAQVEEDHPLHLRALPDTLAYHEGDPVPTGFHLDTRPRRGRLIAGAIIFLHFWGSGIYAAASNKRAGDLAVPFVGGFLWAADGAPACREDGCEAIGVTVSLGQLAGFALFLAGFAPEEILVRDSAGPARVSVRVGAHSADLGGLSLQGSF